MLTVLCRLRRDRSDHRIRTCSLCGWQAGRHWKTHWKVYHRHSAHPRELGQVHPEEQRAAQIDREVRAQEQVPQYWWEMDKQPGDLQPHAFKPDYTRLLAYTAAQLSAGVKVPYMWREFAVTAERVLREEPRPVCPGGLRGLRPPSGEARKKYAALCIEDSMARAEAEVVELESEAEELPYYPSSVELESEAAVGIAHEAVASAHEAEVVALESEAELVAAVEMECESEATVTQPQEREAQPTGWEAVAAAGQRFPVIVTRVAGAPLDIFNLVKMTLGKRLLAGKPYPDIEDELAEQLNLALPGPRAWIAELRQDDDFATTGWHTRPYICLVAQDPAKTACLLYRPHSNMMYP
jgi:hypothetical protein